MAWRELKVSSKPKVFGGVMASPRFTAPDGMPKKQEVDDFYLSVAEADLQPLWTQKGIMPEEPPLSAVPFVWKWKTLQELAERSGELIPIDRGGDRRVLSLSNPGLGGQPYATPTLWGAVQYLGPGEVAPAHRHTPAALRFVVQGTGVWTLVNGDPVSMSPGDLVLTPSWSWHEHHNPGSIPMIWFDALDLPLARSLDAVFFENGPDQMTNRAVNPRSVSEITYAGGPGLIPLEDEGESSPFSPLFAYRWQDTDRALTQLVGMASDGTALLKFVDPTRGTDVMPTMRCSMHRILSGAKTKTTRRSGSSVWVTFRGSAVATIGGERFHLDEGDMFAVPSWCSISIEATQDADFFCTSDAPVFEALGLSRLETLD